MLATVVAATTLYGGTFNLWETLPRYGITTTFVDVGNPEEIEAAIKDNTVFVLIESLGNYLSIFLILKIAEIAHSHKIPLAADNTFELPYLISYLHGVWSILQIQVYRWTWNNYIGGLIVDSGKFDWKLQGTPTVGWRGPIYHNISAI